MTEATPRQAIESLSLEGRTLPPPEAFEQDALVRDQSLYDRANEDWKGFWAEQARALDWFDEWDPLLEGDLPFARWFGGGRLNVSHNCLDRHVAAGRGEKVAF